jgi:hypothetical protein
LYQKPLPINHRLIPFQQGHYHSQNQPSIIENAGAALGGLFDIQPSATDYDPDEAEFQRQQKRKKKKKRGFRL